MQVKDKRTKDLMKAWLGVLVELHPNFLLSFSCCLFSLTEWLHLINKKTIISKLLEESSQMRDKMASEKLIEAITILGPMVDL
jgi:hypothetical protein